jgi:hypothetical protein
LGLAAVPELLNGCIGLGVAVEFVVKRAAFVATPMSIGDQARPCGHDHRNRLRLIHLDVSTTAAVLHHEIR